MGYFEWYVQTIKDRGESLRRKFQNNHLRSRIRNRIGSRTDVDPASLFPQARFRRTRLYRGGSEASEWVTDSGIVVRQDIRLSVPRNSLYSERRMRIPRSLYAYLTQKILLVRSEALVFGILRGRHSVRDDWPLPRMPSRSISRTYTSSTRITTTCRNL